MLTIQSMNAEMIKPGLAKNEGVLWLNKMAIEQMTSFRRYRKQTKSIENKLLNVTIETLAA